MFGTIAGLIGAIVAVVAVAIAYGQLKASRNVADGQLLHKILEDLYSPRFRAARSKLYGLTGKSLKEWSEEEFLAAEEVCRVFSQIGFLVRNGFVDGGELIVWWGGTFVATYQIASPL